MTLAQIGEDRLLQALAGQLPAGREIVAGVGDDCAVLKSPGGVDLLVLKTDCVVEGVHFTRKAAPQNVGWKAMARPLSDFAAMSAIPKFALITFVAPGTTPVSWAKAAYRGLSRAAERYGVKIVGGETSATSGPIMLSVAISGIVEKERWVARSGANAGDVLFVTGRLGGSLAGRHLRFEPRLEESRWLTKNFRINAMMDLSDGLGADLPRLCAASRLGYDIDEAKLPLNRGCSIDDAMNDGEDFELLFSLAPRDAERLERAWQRKFPRLPLTRIGRLTPRKKAERIGGYVHFQQP